MHIYIYNLVEQLEAVSIAYHLKMVKRWIKMGLKSCGSAIQMVHERLVFFMAAGLKKKLEEPRKFYWKKCFLDIQFFSV